MVFLGVISIRDVSFSPSQLLVWIISGRDFSIGRIFLFLFTLLVVLIRMLHGFGRGCSYRGAFFCVMGIFGLFGIL